MPQLRGTVKCPKCGSVYHRALYDFDYISCTEKGCGCDFIKCTGEIWPKNSEPVEIKNTPTNTQSTPLFKQKCDGVCMYEHPCSECSYLP
jgi:hypothetical protein